MATLTDDEIAYLRDSSGDAKLNSSGDYYVSDAKLQWIYDRADQGAGDLDRTIVFALRRIVALTAPLYGKRGAFEGSSEQVNQIHEHYRDLLKVAEARAGMVGDSLSMSTIGLGLDSTCESEYGDL